MDAPTPLFVVGTGRCGSTMLSELLREHAHVLSLSELFSFASDLGGRISRCFPEHAIDAAGFWDIVGGTHPKQSTMLRHGVAMPEMLYRPQTRAAVPAILQATLPHLTSSPEPLLAEIEAFVATLPTAAAGEHYARLFAWLTERFGKRVWVERSGGSLRIVQRLIRAFPNARFLHLVRDGRACALSMSRHLGFRMALVAMQLAEILGVDPYESNDRTWIADVPDELLPLLPEHFDGEAFRRHRVPLPLFGHYWSGEIVQGLRELAEVPADRVATMRYEDFITDPHAAIEGVARFIGAADRDEGWPARVAGRVRRGAAVVDDVDAAEFDALRDACAPGFAALRELYPDRA